MKNLLVKEFRLVVPKGCYLFLLLSALLLIPNYPLIVGIGYCILNLYIIFSNARTNRDAEFSMVLPVSRRDFVRARMGMTVILEALQLAAALPFALAAALLVSPGGNLVGIDPNIAFFGIAVLCLGVFNLIFFPLFFRSAVKSGVPTAVGMAGFLLTYGIFELLVNLLPGWKSALDTLDPAMFGQQAVVLVVGILAFAGMLWASYRISVKNFERVNF